MYFALGLLTAGLVVLVLMPAVWRRAVRLTRARVEASLPMTLAEIEADKDQLRANFAVTTRKLELDVETLRLKLAEDAVARGRSRDDITTLSKAKATLGDTVASLEERVAEFAGALATSENKLATATAEIATRDRKISELNDGLAQLKEQLVAAQILTEELRVEMVARNTAMANIADQLAAATAVETASTTARERLEAELSLERDRLYSERKRADGLAAGLAALEAERISRIAELERGANDKRVLEATLVAERERANALARDAERGRGGLLPEREDDRAEVRRLRERLAEIAINVVHISEAMDGKSPRTADASPPAAEIPPKSAEAPDAAAAEMSPPLTETRH
jgi:chromosome segregation ATPase